MTVKVKRLEWDGHPDADVDPTCNEHYGGGQNNLAGVNEYDVFPHPCAVGMFVLDVMGNRCEDDFPSVEAAKAAAQADYEARILSAIEVPDLDAHIGAVLTEIDAACSKWADECGTTEGGEAWAFGEAGARILALRPDALTALDRVKREARVEGMREAMDVCLSAAQWSASRGLDSFNAHESDAYAIRALIEAERGKP